MNDKFQTDTTQGEYDQEEVINLEELTKTLETIIASMVDHQNTVLQA